MYKKIRVEQLLSLNNPTIIDVREPYEFELGSIPGAINIPIETLLDNYEKYLKLNKQYYLYCETSLRSSRACEFLFDLGYDVYLIEVGYKRWLSLNNIIQ